MCVGTKYLLACCCTSHIATRSYISLNYWLITVSIEANIVDSDQTAPPGSVWSGSILASCRLQKTLRRCFLLCLALYLIEAPFITFAHAQTRQLLSWSPLFAYGNMIRYNPTQVDLTRNVFVLCTNVKVYLATTWDFKQCCIRDQQSLRSTWAYAQSDQSLC